MTDKLIEAVAKAICQSAMDENEVAAKTPVQAFSFSRNTGGDGRIWESFSTDAEAVLAAIEAAGYRVVPVEPTEAMTEAGYALDTTGGRWPADIDAVWAAMLAASPKVTP